MRHAAVTAALALVALSSCKSAVGPEFSALGSNARAVAATSLPTFRTIHAWTRGDHISILGILDSNAGPISPRTWNFRVLFDTDQNPVTPTTSTFPGWDYALFVENYPGGPTRVNKVTNEPDAGPWTGEAQVRYLGRLLVISVPLAALGNDDGACDVLFQIGDHGGYGGPQYRLRTFRQYRGPHENRIASLED